MRDFFLLLLLPRKRIKSPELHPALTKANRRVAIEAANICTNHRNTQDIKVQNPCKKEWRFNHDLCCSQMISFRREHIGEREPQNCAFQKSCPEIQSWWENFCSIFAAVSPGLAAFSASIFPVLPASRNSLQSLQLPS